MASDQRWTGGIANREWTRGHTATREINPAELAAGVKAYLADCHAHQPILSAKYHPTQDSALKAVYHAGPAEAECIRTVFAELTGGGQQ
jgi:hypothetical protein